jgi:purine-binding chemotaxis protein CheW
VEILVFELGRQRYAVPLREVREIVRAVAITPLPTAPPVIEGIIDVRGSVVPVFDLRSRLGLPPKPIALTDHFIIAWTAPRLVAIRVDRADWMATVADAEIEPVRAVTPHSEYLDGIARLPDGLVLIHDLESFLSAAESASLDASLAARAASATAGAAS